MVQQVIDPIVVPVLNLTGDELDEIREQIAAGVLPADWLERHAKAVQNNVYGFDHKTDANGNPIEQGIGSPGNMTRNAVEAYKRWNRDEPEYERHLAKLEKQLLESNARRRAEAAQRKAEAKR